MNGNRENKDSTNVLNESPAFNWKKSMNRDLKKAKKRLLILQKNGVQDSRIAKCKLKIKNMEELAVG